MNKEDRIKYAAECLDSQERERFFKVYKNLNSSEWTVFWDIDEGWAQLSLWVDKEEICVIHFGNKIDQC